MRKEWISAYLFLLPAYLLFAVFMFFPIFSGLQISFFEWSINGSVWVGLGNYLALFQDPAFWKAMWITFLYTVVVLVLGLATSMIISFAIEPLSERLQTFFKSAFYLPAVAPIVAITIVWGWLYNPSFGLFNQILDFMGLDSVLWLGDPQMALWSIVIMTLAVSQGPNILILVASLGSIPKDYYEAARIDGANLLYETLRIKIPLLKPTLLYLTITNTVGSFQVFAPVYLLTSGGPNGATRTLGYLIYESGFKKFQFGLAAAQAIILLVLVMVIGILQFRAMSSDLEY